MEYINVKLAMPWMGKMPAYADNDVLFTMGLECEEHLNEARLTEPIVAQFVEAGVPLPGKTRIRARENVWQMYGEDGGVQYRIRKDGEILNVMDVVVDLEQTPVMPMTRLMAEKLIDRKVAIPVSKKKKKPEGAKATKAPANKKASASEVK